MDKVRIFLTGVGGQGTLTATTLLARIALDCGIPVTSGEIHGMAQRGGVVESTVLLGGCLSPRIGKGEADVLLGFEPMETLRALPYLRPGGTVLSCSEPLPPVSVSLGRETYPEFGVIERSVRDCAPQARFIPCLSLARQAGTVLCANTVLLGALCASGLLPFGSDELDQAIDRYLKPKIRDMNRQAATLAAGAL